MTQIIDDPAMISPTVTVHPRKPEIMSPAGYWPQLQAAIEAGADAVYFGLKHFTARAKVGFSLAELPDVMRTLHQRGVKGYVTFNTLVFDHELAEAARSLAAIAETGADSIIVQDVGIAQLARQIAPELEIHGSTQMSLTSAEGIRLAQQFGVTRVVLARELSLDEVRAIRSQTDCELEMFVHGALCVSYSGQCFSSEAWGGRSANRGQCAQACRLPYELIVDQVLKPLGDARYLLSPGDLYALHQMPEIVQIGISALKIEGRYKDANYVALTTSAYRKAVDEAWAGRPLSISRAEELQLEQVYSRGLGAHFVTGTNHQTVVTGRSPGHRGVCIGKVTSVQQESVLIEPRASVADAPLKPGDGLVFDAADWRSPEESEEGGRVYQVAATRRGQIEVHFGNGAINFSRIRPGDLVWRTDDPALEKVVRPFTEANTPLHKQPLTVRVTAHQGSPLVTEWRLVEQPQTHATVVSDDPLGAAQNRALTAEFVRDQLGRLGNTAYELADLETGRSRQPLCAQLAAEPPAPPGGRAAERNAKANRALSPFAIRKLASPLYSHLCTIPRCTRIPRSLTPAASPRQHCTCWSVHLSNWMQRLTCGRPALRWTIWSCMAYDRRWNACRKAASWRVSPALAFSSPTNSASSISCSGWSARSWCVLPACCTRCKVKPASRSSGISA